MQDSLKAKEVKKYKWYHNKNVILVFIPIGNTFDFLCILRHYFGLKKCQY
jgi:hypothetical protein